VGDHNFFERGVSKVLTKKKTHSKNFAEKKLGNGERTMKYLWKKKFFPMEKKTPCKKINSS
jgi:hypothetical protein